MTETTEESARSHATARMADGTILRTLHWPAAGTPRGVVTIVHGLGEHGGRYETVAKALTAEGFEVHAHDHRGFGGSAGLRAYIDRWSQFHDDLQERVVALRARYPGLPLVMYAHSMGGLIGTGYVLDHGRPQPDLLILSAPGLDADLPEWKRVMARALRHVFPKMRVPNGLPKGGRSADPAVDAAVAADPLAVSESTVKFGAAAFDEQVRVRGLLADMTAMPMPTYVLHGSDDPIVPVRATEVFAQMGEVTRRVHAGLRHECHHDFRHADVLAEVVSWMHGQLAGRIPATV